MKDNRKLSKAELKRKEQFDKLTEELAQQGYRPNHITMGALAANILALVVAIPFIVFFVIMFQLCGHEIMLEFYEIYLALFIMFVLVIVHELIHGITWAAFVKDGWKSISFGFIVEYLTPYCSCNQPMKKYQIIIGAIMPTVILGFIPAIVAVITGSSLTLMVALLLIMGGGGDMIIIFKLLCFKSTAKDVLFIDHPYELGTAVFERD